MSEREPRADREYALDSSGHWWRIDSADETTVVALASKFELEPHDDKRLEMDVPHFAKHTRTDAAASMKRPDQVQATLVELWVHLWGVVEALVMWNRSGAEARRVVYVIDHRDVGRFWRCTRLLGIAGNEKVHDPTGAPEHVTEGSFIRSLYSLQVAMKPAAGPKATDCDAIKWWRRPELDDEDGEARLAFLTDRGGNRLSTSKLEVTERPPVSVEHRDGRTLAAYTLRRQPTGVALAFVEVLPPDCPDPLAEAHRRAEARRDALRSKLGVA